MKSVVSLVSVIRRMNSLDISKAVESYLRLKAEADKAVVVIKRVNYDVFLTHYDNNHTLLKSFKIAVREYED